MNTSLSKASLSDTCLKFIVTVIGTGSLFLIHTSVGAYEYLDLDTGWLTNDQQVRFLQNFSVSGNVGIGTTTPASTLELRTSTPIITLSPSGYTNQYQTTLGTRSGAQGFLIFGNNAQNEIRAGRTLAGGYLDFYTNNTADQSLASNGNLAMRLVANGNVGIGNTAPSQKLSVTDTASITNVGGAQRLLMGNQDSAGVNRPSIIQAANSSTEIGYGNSWAGNGGTFTNIAHFDVNGNVGIGTTTPGLKFHVVGANEMVRFENTDTTANTYTQIGLKAGSATSYLWTANQNSTNWGGANSLNIYAGAGGAMTLWTNAGEKVRIDTLGNVGIGTTTPGAKLDVAGGIVRQSGYIASDSATDNLLVNGDFEMGNLSGWSGFDSVVNAAASSRAGTYVAQRAGNGSVLSDDYIPVNPTQDVFQLDGYFKKTVAGTTPGVIYFGYIAYDQNKTAITTSPCGTYCYFAASGYGLPADGNWHKFSATTTGEGVSFPNFPVGTKYVRVLVLINYAASADSVTQMDHVTLKKINNGPLFVGNNFNGSNLSNQNQSSKLYTTTSNNLILEPQNNVGIGTNSPGQKLDVSGGSIRTTNQLISTLATGTAPLAVSSTTVNTNLNADLLDGQHGSYYAPLTAVAGTTNYVSKFTGANSVGNSQIFDNGTNVGIGTTSPQSSLDVVTPANSVVSIGANTLGVGQYAGIAFGYRENNTSYRKSAIVFERTDNSGGGGNAAGKVHILNGPAIGAGSATLSDSRLTIGETGNVGIGTTAPGAKLDVNGSASINGDITVVGKVITDTLVNRTVAQLTVSGSIFPNATSSQKDLGATGNRWANLWLSGNANVTGSVTANSFAGNGASLTSLNPANISAGTAGISISGNAENVTTPTATYKHLGAWGVGRTAVGAILVNTAYLADNAGNADTVDSIHGTSMFRNFGTIGSATDWNTFNDGNTKLGMYQINNGSAWTNGPGNYPYGGLFGWKGDNHNFQLYASHTASNGDGLRYRTGWDNSWYAWRTLIDSSNIGSQSVNYATSAGNADTTDGYHMNQNVLTTSSPTFVNHLVTAGNGNGICFWTDCTNYKISMGNAADYLYGTVSDYSIKTQMSQGSPGRGFTWGNQGLTPIASLNSTSGNMQITGTMTAPSHIVTGGGQFMAGNNALNMKIKAGSTGATGISGYDSADAWRWQLYGDGTNYGFLNNNWGGWDIQKTIGGALTLNGSQTVLHSGNYNSYAPTLTGGGASGTWGINVTGNAGTASSAPLLSSLGAYVWSAGSTPTAYPLGIQTSFVQSANGFQSYGSVLTMNTYSAGGGALQLYTPYSPTYGGNGLQVRFGNYDVSGGNSWTSWKTLLASDNFNSYAPTLTGVGASGTWGINITGNADTTDGLHVNSTTTNNEANKIVRTDGSGYANFGWINTPSGVIGDWGHGNTKFYASNDSYIRYLDRNSMKVQLGLTSKWDADRRDYTADSNYFVGSMGWGTTDLNSVFDWGSGFWDSWSSPANSPGDSSHYVGINADHYTNGTTRYGWQMAGGATSRPWFRNTWGGSFGGWQRMLTDSNDPYAYNMNQYVRTTDSPTFAGVYISGNNSLNFNSYGGGWYMSDTSWMRAVGDKNIWLGGGLLGSNGGLTVGYGGAGSPGGGAIIAGNVGIGTTNPGSKLDVNGELRVSNSTAYTRILHSGPSGGNTHIDTIGGGGGLYLNWFSGGAGVIIGNGAQGFGNITAGGFYYGSDIRLKKDIKLLDSSLDKILKLNGYNFTWKNTGRKDIGVIAQEVEAVFPELVGESQNQSGATYKTVEYGNLVAPLIEAVKELKTEKDTEIEELRNENRELKELVCLDHPEAQICKIGK